MMFKDEYKKTGIKAKSAQLCGAGRGKERERGEAVHVCFFCGVNYTWLFKMCSVFLFKNF